MCKFMSPFCGNAFPDAHHEKSVPKKSSRTAEEEELHLSYFDTPSLLLSDDDMSSCATQEEKNDPWHFGINTDDDRILADAGERHVRFDNARIREHGITLGDHPMCCGPLPLTLDWCHSEERVYDINDYEQMREFRERGRQGHVTRLNYRRRKKILEESGLSNISKSSQSRDAPLTMPKGHEDDMEDALFQQEDPEEPSCEIEVYAQNFGFPGHMVKVVIIED